MIKMYFNMFVSAVQNKKPTLSPKHTLQNYGTWTWRYIHTLSQLHEKRRSQISKLNLHTLYINTSEQPLIKFKLLYLNWLTPWAITHFVAYDPIFSIRQGLWNYLNSLLNCLIISLKTVKEIKLMKRI